MPQLRANGIDLEYETSGDPQGTPVLFIMGLGAPLTRWPIDFLQPFVDAGYYVIRFDNRDVGLSTKMSEKAKLGRTALFSALGLPSHPPYSLYDMASDALGLLDGLSKKSAHLVGVSMGGMIAQILAAKHPERVRSLVSIMSNSGSRSVPGPSLSLRLELLRRSPFSDRNARILRTAQILKQIGSKTYPRDLTELRTLVEKEYERGVHLAGYFRQLAAIIGSESRLPLLAGLRVPTLILHGTEDPLVPEAAAHDLHRRIPSSQLEVIAGMGRDLPAPLLPRITRRIVAHLAQHTTQAE